MNTQKERHRAATSKKTPRKALTAAPGVRRSRERQIAELERSLGPDLKRESAFLRAELCHLMLAIDNKVGDDPVVLRAMCGLLKTFLDDIGKRKSTRKPLANRPHKQVTL